MRKFNRSIVGGLAFGCVGAAGFFLMPAAKGDIVVYSDLTNTNSVIILNGSVTPVGASNYTAEFADDLTPAAGFSGLTVTSISYSVANNNGSAVTVEPDLRFYADSSGVPGTLLDSFSVTPVTVAGDTVQVFTLNPSTGSSFALPSGQFWAGITFDDGAGTLGITPTELANVGVGLYDPPTTGSSTNIIWESSGGGSFAVSNPAGSLATVTGQVANFGWAISVPEPSSLVLAGVGIGALLARRRRGLRGT